MKHNCETRIVHVALGVQPRCAIVGRRIVAEWVFCNNRLRSSRNFRLHPKGNKNEHETNKVTLKKRVYWGVIAHTTGLNVPSLLLVRSWEWLSWKCPKEVDNGQKKLKMVKRSWKVAYFSRQLWFGRTIAVDNYLIAAESLILVDFHEIRQSNTERNHP